MLIFPVRGKLIDTSAARHKVVQTQALIDTIRFDILTPDDGADLADTSLEWLLVYTNAEGKGDGAGLSPAYEDGVVHLLWVPSESQTSVAGELRIQIVATRPSDGGRWLSGPARVVLMEALDPQESPGGHDSFDQKLAEVKRIAEETTRQYESLYKMNDSGSVATKAELPVEDVPVGAVYDVAEDGKNYIWTGKEWDSLGGDAYGRNEMDSLLAKKQANVLVAFDTNTNTLSLTF